MNTRFFVTLILSSLLCGTGIGIVTAIQRGLAQGMKAGALVSLLIGLLMAAIIIPVQLLATRNLTSKESESRQFQEFMVTGSVPIIFDLLCKALSELKFIQNIETNIESKSITSKTRMSWASFGEVIVIKAREAGDGKVSVTISSSPAMRVTAADYGKNARNIRAILEKLADLGVRDVQLKHPNVTLNA